MVVLKCRHEERGKGSGLELATHETMLLLIEWHLPIWILEMLGMNCHCGKFKTLAHVFFPPVFHSDIHHKAQPNFNDSNLPFVLKHRHGLHWTSSRFRFTVRMKESLSVFSMQSFSSGYSLLVWHIPEPFFHCPLCCLSIFLPVSCFLYTYTAQACASVYECHV